MDASQLYKTKFAIGIKNAVKQAEQIKNAALSPDEFLKTPKLISGGRVYLVIGGELVAFCQSISWSINNVVEVNTSIDSHVPWEIVPTVFSVTLNIRQLVLEDESAESQGLWTTMSSNPHQPNMEISIYDKTGVNILNVRGMANRISQNISAGQLMSRDVSFQGVMFTHNVSQGFVPYSEEDFTDKLKSARDKVSKATLGIL